MDHIIPFIDCKLSLERFELESAENVDFLVIVPFLSVLYLTKLPLRWVVRRREGIRLQEQLMRLRFDQLLAQHSFTSVEVCLDFLRGIFFAGNRNEGSLLIIIIA